MNKLRLVIALLVLASTTMALTGSSGALAADEQACTWVGDTEVCVPPR